jgi:hypothetical protein
VAIFQPVDMMGPAHRGPQIQALAQHAAKNVMMRSRMRALLQQGARGAAQAGGGQHLVSSMRARPMGLRGHAGPGGGVMSSLASMLAMNAGGGNQNFPGGDQNESGGGFDFSSLADPNDPSQSASSTFPGAPTPPVDTGAGTGFNPNGPGPTPVGSGTDGAPLVNNNPSAPNDVVAGPDMGSGNAAPGTGLIHLGGGMYYDPATDSVRGGGR